VAAFDTQSSLKEGQSPVRIGKPLQGAIAFEGVSFSYDGRGPVLNDVSFQIQPANRIALVGSNGSGKSTIAKLMARLYDPNIGVVRIDGVDVRDLRLKDLRTAVCYLPQHAVLFDGDLRDNLLLGRPTAREDELADAVRMAELTQIVDKLPRGLYETLGPGGNQLSGGERQRVAIARAILQRPTILVLDEATSYLDLPSEERILSSLTNFLPTTTLVVISHHFSTLRCVNQFFVLQSGMIVAEGPRAALSETNHFYAELFTGSDGRSETTIPFRSLPRHLTSGRLAEP